MTLQYQLNYTNNKPVLQMNDSSIPTDYFHSKLPKSMVTSIVPKPPSAIRPASNIMDTQFTFGKLNTIREVSEPSSSNLQSNYSQCLIISGNTSQVSPKRAMNDSQTRSLLNQSMKRSNPPKESIVYLEKQKDYRTSLKLKAIEEQQDDKQRNYQRRQETFWDKFRRWWGENSCCQRQDRHVRISGAW